MGEIRKRPFDLLIVAIDGNCRGYRERRDEIGAIVEQSGYPAPVVSAIPDPHVERWYLADPQALRQALDVDVTPDVPAYKCERDRYKQALSEAIRRTGVIAPLGGVEYGPDIARTLDLYAVGRADAGFKHFVDELRARLAPFATGTARRSTSGRRARGCPDERE